jgi:uncharacterized protein YbbK (DUF523 family)
MRICSACFLGIRCRYSGVERTTQRVMNLTKKEVLIPVCPEQLGGLETPRDGCGITSGDGHEVLSGHARVQSVKGQDFTDNFVRGAEEVLKIAELYDISEAILKQGSPSCGSGSTLRYIERGGKFKLRKIKGDGVTTALLKRNGITVKSESDRF